MNPLGFEKPRFSKRVIQAFAERMETEEDIIITPIPSLVATLLNRECAKGSPLSREEVESIRDEAPSVALTPTQRAAVDERRQYDDIDPEWAWEEWQFARLDLETCPDESDSEQDESTVPSEPAPGASSDVR